MRQRDRTKHRAGSLALAWLFVVALPGPGLAAEVEASATPAGESRLATAPLAPFYGYYAPPVVFVEKKGALLYTNLDIVQHDVVQDPVADGVSGRANKPWCESFQSECPVFWSPRAGFGETVAVKGLGRVKPNSRYTFYCTLHPTMRGTLVVQP